MRRYFKLVRSEHGQGGFLDPPRSPQHSYEVHEHHGNGRVIGWYSLEAALADPAVSGTLKARIRSLYKKADMQPTEEWLSQVYGYFKNCYSPDSTTREVDKCLIVRPAKEGEEGPYRIGTFGEQPLAELPPIETSLAVMLVRRFFPDHEPREDLLTMGKWGKETQR